MPGHHGDSCLWLMQVVILMPSAKLCSESGGAASIDHNHVTLCFLSNICSCEWEYRLVKVSLVALAQRAGPMHLEKPCIWGKNNHQLWVVDLAACWWLSPVPASSQPWHMVVIMLANLSLNSAHLMGIELYVCGTA